MKKIILFTLLILLYGFTFAQQTVGLFSNQNTAYNGYTLFNSFGSKTTYLIDNCGTIVYEWNSNYGPAAAVYLLEDGNLLRTNRLDSTTFSFGGSGGGIEILDSSSNVIWQYEVNSDSTLSHHDLEVLPNGNILILAIEFISAQEADDNGSEVTADRYSEMILEVNPTTDQIVWEWHAWDHLIQDTDSTLANYGIISDNPGRININYGFKEDGSDPDWIHANSIDYNPDLDQIIINSPTFNEFWIIDHSTTTTEAADNIGGISGNGGDILYRWGNPQAYNRGDSTNQVFEFQHDAHWIPSGLPDEGKIMIFNNGDQRKYSSIDIIEPPRDTSNFNNYFLTSNSTPYGPLNLYWSYSDSVNFYSSRVSGAQQLQNGNILICSGFQGKLFEIEHQTDSVVWEYIIPVNQQGPITQGAAAAGNNIFRTHRHSPSYSGFNNLNLTPTTVIELNPLPSNCEIYINGCTDATADNYDPAATVDDGSCTYSGVCNEDAPTGLSVTGIVHTRATINWDNMNSASCVVDQYRIRYREVGTSSWSTKTMGAPVGSCTFGTQKTDKLLLNLTASTTYEYEMKAWYCGGGNSAWTGLNQFTTLDNCPNVGNFAAYGANSTKATFDWDASNGVYEFARIKMRVDSISNPTGSDWTLVGGFGVPYGTNTKNKNGLVPGETYRGQARTWCDPNGGAWKSVSWTPLVYWTQPTSRIEGGTAITNLDVYPNPSRDVFNVTFTSEDVQDLEVRVINVVSEVVYTDNLQQFVGEYTKSLDLAAYTKGIYFLEITTNDGVINKKLILQ